MKVWRNIFIMVLLVVIVAVAGWQIHRWQLKRALTQYRVGLVAKGEKLTFPELRAGWKLPKYNSAAILLQAGQRIGQAGVSRTNPPASMQPVSRGRAVPSWKMPTVLSLGHATNSWAELESDLAAKREAIELLHELTVHPECDFELAYETGFSLPLPHLSQFKGCAQVLGSAATLELRRSNTSAATEHILAMLALGDGLEREPLVISQLVRMAVVQIAIGVIWDFLQSPGVNDADLQQIQTHLAALEFAAAMERSFECERTINCSMIARMRETGDVAGMIGRKRSPASGSTLALVQDRFERYFSPKVIHERAVELTWTSTSSFRDELLSLSALQILIESTRCAQTNAPYLLVLANCDAMFAALGIVPEKDNDSSLNLGFQPPISLAGLHALFTQSPAALRGSLKRVERIEASRALAVTAIALCRYYLIHGEYPGDLAALSPEFLSTLPRDPVDGQPLRYRRSADDSFVLYSVGEDGKDDNGDPTPADSASKSISWQSGRDWVWPQPANAAEIETYVQDRTKKAPR